LLLDNPRDSVSSERPRRSGNQKECENIPRSAGVRTKWIIGEYGQPTARRAFESQGASGQMALIDEIRGKFARDEFEFSRHAVDQTIRRRIAVAEIRQAVLAGEIIEDYPEDKYGPSCLLFGKTVSSRPLHVHISYSSRPVIKVVTVYEPDPNQWIDFRVRKP
jgi:hypothetical protein